MRLRLLIEYEGTNYSGWQIQRGNCTIQGEIEAALNIILHKPVRITGAGRTDSGVHARGQIAHLNVDLSQDLKKLQASLNGLLSRDVRIKDISKVNDDFHARYSAIGREYCYLLSRKPSALFRNFSWYIPYALDVDRMRHATTYIIGKHDFRSFCRAISTVKHHYCIVQEAKWFEEDEMLKFIIKANRFIHGMVRALVGTLIDVGRGKLNGHDFKEILLTRNRIYAGQSAPAKGLILEKIYYS
jgi:tRNA pseudouridine38-40 synthase